MTHVLFPAQAAKECGNSYPIVNYTVKVEEFRSSKIDINHSDTFYTVSLTPKEFPDLATDMKYTAYIIACTSITCHQSDGVEICKSHKNNFFLFLFRSIFLSYLSSHLRPLSLSSLLPILFFFCSFTPIPSSLNSPSSPSFLQKLLSTLCSSLVSHSLPPHPLPPSFLQIHQTSSLPLSPLPTRMCTSVVHSPVEALLWVVTLAFTWPTQHRPSTFH